MKVRSLLMAIVIFLLPPLTAESEAWYGDVPDNSVYRDAIWYMTTAGFAGGYPDNTFHPDNPINRAEALKMILTSSKTSIEDGSGLILSDVSEDDWYLSYLNTALTLGIISGYPDGTFRPTDAVNRAEALKMLIEASGIELTGEAETDWYQKYLDYAIEKSLIVPDSSGDYIPANPLTRGEFSEIIFRLYNNAYTGEVEYGGATWYGGKFEGEGTASGDIYDGSKLTAAHKTLPFGTLVKVTNLANNLSVTVKINDRGPYRDGYIIDLSSAAFEKIANLSAGVLNTRVEVLR